MNKRKEDMLINRNKELSDQLKDYQNRIKIIDSDNKVDKQEFDSLITELNDLRKEWIGICRDLAEQSERYDEILYEVNSIKNSILRKSTGLLFKWMIRSIWSSIKFMFYKIFHKRKYKTKKK